jgi:flagellar motor component MotA
MNSYDDLFKTAMEVYKVHCPEEYNTLQSQLKEMACDLRYMCNMSMHDEVADLLRENQKFMRVLLVIAISGKSYKETIESYTK